MSKPESEGQAERVAGEERAEFAPEVGVLARVAEEAGAAVLAAEARALGDRLREGLFYVACVGQFKRGKSSLLNALVGVPVLPVGVVPVTAVVTVVRHGPRPAARLRFATDDWRDVGLDELAGYVTEGGNPGNRKGVTGVEVFVPSPLLAGGMCFVDTPGIGSVFLANTEATRAFVPHIDAALVVLGADPPISAEELALVEEIGAQCRDLLVVLNKSDRVPDAERAVAREFTRAVLAERLSGREPAIFETSATERMAGAGPLRDWAGLREALARLAGESGRELVRRAAERGTGWLAERLRRHLAEQREMLLRPVEESEQRIEALRACVAEAERSLDDLSYLFTAEEDRLRRAFVERKEAFLRGAREAVRREVEEACHPKGGRRGPGLRARAMAAARETAERHLDAWLAEAAPAAEASYAAAMDRFVKLSVGFLEQLRASGDPLLAMIPLSVNRETGFRWDSRLFYRDIFPTTGEGLALWVADLFRPRRSLERSIERRAVAYVMSLVEMNATRIENDLTERVVESRRRFQFEIRAALAAVVESAEQALSRAKQRKAEGRGAVQAEVERVEALGRELAGIERGAA